MGMCTLSKRRRRRRNVGKKERKSIKLNVYRCLMEEIKKNIV